MKHDVVDLHRQLVEIRSVSGEEAEIAGFALQWLSARGARVERLGNSLLAHRGDPSSDPLLLNSHLDTVPPSGDWSFDPFQATAADGRVHGLGSNDAKASVAALMVAFVSSPARADLPGLLLTLVEGEETKGEGTRAVFGELQRRGVEPRGAVFGEPTGLDIAVAQKGLMILELHAHGTACHVAHAERLSAKNAISVLAHDLVALESVDLGGEHPFLGRTTMSPTQASGGVAHNVIPASATAVLDLRTTPELTPDELADRVRSRVVSDVVLRSSRLLPTAIDPAHPLVAAALEARPEATLFGSPTLSDMARMPAFFPGVPAIKVGPGRTERSHTPDEYVTVDELAAGAAFFLRLIDVWHKEAW